MQLFQFLLCVATFSQSVVTASVILHKRAALDNCLASRQVPTYSLGTKNYTQATQPFNLRVPVKPAAFAVPRTTKNVQDAVACGVQNKVQVSAKGGGHSYGSHGLGGEDGHLVLDMRHFNSVTVDPQAHTAVIGAGGRLGNIALALYAQGKQATSHGTCPGVGIGGLSLHGGYGLISRLKGLSLDNMLEATVVLSDSTVVTASETQNKDLFWALRGAGGAFGIVTSFKFKTFTAPESNIVFEYFLTPSNTTQFTQVLTVLQDFTARTQPPELNMRLFLPGYSLSGVYYGDRQSFDAIMNPLLIKLNYPTTGSGSGPAPSIATKTWINTLTSFSNGPLAQPEVYDEHENFYAKSLMAEYLPREALAAMSDYYYNTALLNTDRSWFVIIDLHGGARSAISNIADDATAYSHRKATFKILFYDRLFNNTDKYDPAWFSFLGNWVDAIQDAGSSADFGMYINYADTNLTKSEAHRNYWGPHYEKLVAIKAKYDGAKAFGGPQLVGS